VADHPTQAAGRRSRAADYPNLEAASPIRHSPSLRVAIAVVALQRPPAGGWAAA